MTNQVIIKTLKKAAICFKDKANEIITRLNVPWKVKMPEDNTKWGTAEVSYSDKEIVVDLTKVNYVTVTACDEEGNQKKYVLLGYAIEEAEDDD